MLYVKVKDSTASRLLRSVRASHHTTGHPDYRFIYQEIWRQIQQVHPALAESGKFIDRKKYRLGRLKSEMGTEFKKLGMDKKKISGENDNSTSSEATELSN
jgi:hypothetical protein